MRAYSEPYFSRAHPQSGHDTVDINTTRPSIPSCFFGLNDLGTYLDLPNLAATLASSTQLTSAPLLLPSIFHQLLPSLIPPPQMHTFSAQNTPKKRPANLATKNVPSCSIHCSELLDLISPGSENHKNLIRQIWGRVGGICWPRSGGVVVERTPSRGSLEMKRGCP